MVARLKNHFLCAMAFAGAAFLTGCAAKGPAATAPSTSKIETLDGHRELTPEQLNDLTHSYADRFVGLIASATDDVKRGEFGSVTPAQRRRAQSLKLNCARAAYDIAMQPEPFSRVLDLAVLATLESQVWIDDAEAESTFGANGQP